MEALAARKVRIMIADDEPVVRAALGQLIASEPAFELVGIAKDSDDAIAIAKHLRPDVALVDVRMPGGGPAAARGIRKGSSQTKVVALSAYGDRETVLEMIRSGAVGYLIKGAPGTEVLDTIARCARGESRLSTEITGDVVAELCLHLDLAGLAEESRRDQVNRIRAVLDGGGPEIVFQPIVDLDSKVALGYEALSRFPDSEPPDRWFADAELVGLRAELELQAAAVALRYLDDLPPASLLSINMSPEILGVEPCQGLAKGATSRVVFELTEQAPVEDYDSLAGVLSDLRLQGVRIAVDDFGAGFASLRHILDLVPEFIKLDATLTQGVEGDPGRRALAQAMITFADRLGSTIVAEGIETEAQLETLRRLGVRYGQGYYIARPGPLP